MPVLMYVVGYPARTAVPLNLAVSLVTLTFALVVRSRAVSVAALAPYLNEVAGLAVGGVASAFYGARFVSAIKNDILIKTIAYWARTPRNGKVRLTVLKPATRHKSA